MSPEQLAMKLRERGFAEAPEDVQVYLERRMSLRVDQLSGPQSTLNRKQRMRRERVLAKPNFIYLASFTFARIGNGSWWTKEARENLTPLGFNNISAMVPIALTLPPLNTKARAH